MSNPEFPIYRLYGLRVRSQIPLPASPYPESGFDVDILLGADKEVPKEPASTEILAAAEFNATQGYFFSRYEDAFTLRLYGFCEFVFRPEAKTIVVHRDPRVSPELAGMFLVGNVMTFWLSLSGEFVLHASAVSRAEKALAFVGASGMGKSTMAALCCRHGFSFLADDVVRFSKEQPGIYIYPGPGELRLRTGAAELARQFEGCQSETADKRFSVRLEPRQELVPLHAVIIPKPSRTQKELKLVRLSKSQALFHLSAFPRVMGWKAESMIKGQFEAYARVASSVPVYEGIIPWGPPFAPDLVNQLMAEIHF